ncbi:YidH family protein [Demequina sp. NBRC 110051]|uniref:YidH family protein n=1 Tax=Demequina sp. NBRC 110051 TaxID=1570340 RepID=UPI0009FF63B6|nr:DUF202 domain-containing protein [Demequina sp. NBRC 110051]
MSAHTRFPRSVYTRGREPDVRFSFANERTYLAWMRTALALMAAGVALEALAVNLHPGLRLSAALVLIGAGLVLPSLAWAHWMKSERALRLDGPLPGSWLGLVVAVAVTAAGALVVWATVGA